MSDLRQPLFKVNGDGLLETEVRMVPLDDEKARSVCQMSGCTREGVDVMELIHTCEDGDETSITAQFCRLHRTFLVELTMARERADSIREDRLAKMN